MLYQLVVSKCLIKPFKNDFLKKRRKNNVKMFENVIKIGLGTRIKEKKKHWQNFLTATKNILNKIRSLKWFENVLFKRRVTLIVFIYKGWGENQIN